MLFSEKKRAQSGAVFRLLVEAIMGLVILAIIVGAISYMEQFRHEVSQKKLFDAIRNATKSPNGDIIPAEDLVLREQTLSKRLFENETGVPADCFDLRAVGGEGSAFKLHDNSVEIKMITTTDVYASCIAVSEPDCNMQCVVSFGEALDEDWHGG